MTHVSLFSGIGGIDLAAEWAGFTTIAQVERDPYCLAVLAKHWPDVPRVAEVRDFPDRDYGAVTLVSGGFPCQPFSAAGKRRGRSDDRHLWPEMLRVIRAVKPAWVLAENVPGLLAIESGMAFEAVLTDLETAGYETWTSVIPAAGVGAPHLRYRVFIVGHAECKSGTERGKQSVGGFPPQTARFSKSSADVGHAASIGSRTRGTECERQQGSAPLVFSSTDVADASGERCREAGQDCERRSERIASGGSVADTECSRRIRAQKGRRQERRRFGNGDWWATEPDVGRVAHGVPHRVDRLRTLGNAVVPQQVYPILWAISETERIGPWY